MLDVARPVIPALRGLQPGGNDPESLAAPRSSLARIAQLAAASRTRAGTLTTDAETIVRETFNSHFPSELSEKLGLVLVADGSFGRKMLVHGHSDIDLSFYATKINFEDLSPADNRAFSKAKASFTQTLKAKLGVLQLSADSRYQCRLGSDLENELKTASSGKITDLKVAAESLTKFFSIRPLCGDAASIDSFPGLLNRAWQQISSNPELRNMAVSSLVRLGSDIVSGHRLVKSVQDVKEQPLTLATMCSSLCHILKNGQNDSALDSLRADLADRAYLICAVREFLPRDKQQIGPHVNSVLPIAIKNVYGEQPDIIPLTYRASAWIAACFDYLVEEAASQGCLQLTAGYQAKTDLSQDFCSRERVREIFSKAGNVAMFLHYGLLSESLTEYLPELTVLDGVPDLHPYQRLTLGEHSIDCVAKLDALFRGSGDPRYVSLTKELSAEETAALYLATTLHDCGKPEEHNLATRTFGTPIDPEYHAEVGAKKAREAAMRLRFSEEQTNIVAGLVRNHLWFRHSKAELSENLADGTEALPLELRSPKTIKMLALLAYADDSSTDPAGWNTLRANHVYELSHAYTCMLEGRPNGLTLKDAGAYAEFLFAQHAGKLQDANLASLREHLSLFPASYLALPPETICAFYQMSRAADISGQPQIQIVPHHLFEFEEKSGQPRWDFLFVAPDKPHLASNLVESLSKKGLKVHSAGFAVNSAGRVFNQLTVTHERDISESFASLQQELQSKLQAESLPVPRIRSSFTFDSDVGVSVNSRPQKVGGPGVCDVTLITADKDKLLLRLLSGLNQLKLGIIGAEITTRTGEHGRLMAINRFQIVNLEDPYGKIDEDGLQAQLEVEFQDPDESQSGL